MIAKIFKNMLTAILCADVKGYSRPRGEDHRVAASFPYNLVCLHSFSLLLFDRMVGGEALKCIQINKDQSRWGVPKMLIPFKMVQIEGKRLLIRGELDPEDLFHLREGLSPKGP